MLAIARRTAIKKLVEQRREVLVADLSKKFKVSESTIRRDLDVLVEQRVVNKTYGGAVLCQDAPTVQEPLFSDRVHTQKTEKQNIAKCAASFIQDGDVIILDAGTTTSFMVPHLKEKKDITVITNAVNICYELLPYEHIEVIMLGGILRHRTDSVFSPESIKYLEGLWANKLFLSCSGVDVLSGVTVSNPISVSVRKQMVESADTTILLADSTKIGKRQLAQIASLDQVAYFITGQTFEARKAYEHLGIEVVVCNDV